MLKKLYETGLEKCAGNEDEAAEFVIGFVDALVKQSAMDMKSSVGKQRMSPSQEIITGIAGSIGKGLGGLGIGIATSAGGSMYKSLVNSNLKIQYHKALEIAIRNSRILKEADKNKVMSFGETVFKFAPNVATDANLLGMVLTNAIHGDSIDPATIQTLGNLEKTYGDNSSYTLKGIKT